MDASRQWHSLTKEGRAAAATLCLFEYLPVEQKVKMMQSDSMLVKAWAYLDNTGSKDLRRALASWRDGAMIAYASSKSAEFTALESVGLLQKAEHIISSAIMPRLPSVTNVESGMRLGSLVIGFSLAGVILSACGGKPPDVSTAMPEKSPTPDLVSLVSTHPAMHKMLTDYKISEQCSFPSADVLAPADYITTINSHLTTAEAAFLHVPQTVDLEGYVLICDDNGNVYLQSDQEEILMPTQDGFIEAILVDGNLQAFVPTAEIMPSPTRVYHLDTGGPLTEERFSEIISLDSTVVDQIMWLNDWAAWYDSSEQRPLTSEVANKSVIFFEWVDAEGNLHYKAAWKLDADYPGYIIVPPVENWASLNPPDSSDENQNHVIGIGNGPVFISTSTEEGTDLANLGVPVDAKLAAEQMTGDWVMVHDDMVVARVNNETGYWEYVFPGTPGVDALGPYIEQDGVKYRQIELANGESIWAFSINEGENPIPILDLTDANNAGTNDQMLFQLVVDPRVSGSESLPILSHPILDKPVTGHIVTFHNAFLPFFTSSRGILNKQAPFFDIKDNKVKYSFATPLGSFEWQASTKIKNEQNITTIIRRMEDLPLLDDNSNGVVMYSDKSDSSKYFLVKMYTVEGKLFCEIASSVPLNEMNHLQLAEIALFPIAVIKSDNHSVNQRIVDVQDLLNTIDRIPIFRIQ
jgi:hypothetical protein